MNEQISTLTPEQAQKAVLIFYDLVPDSMWSDEIKLSSRDVEAFVDDILKTAPDDVRQILNALMSDENDETKGTVSRNLLQELYEYHDLQPYVHKAVSKALEPTMAPIPLFIGAYIIAMAMMSISGSTYDRETTKYDSSGRIIQQTKGHLVFDPEKALKQFGNIKGIFKFLTKGAV